VLVALRKMSLGPSLVEDSFPSGPLSPFSVADGAVLVPDSVLSSCGYLHASKKGEGGCPQTAGNGHFSGGCGCGDTSR